MWATLCQRDNIRCVIYVHTSLRVWPVFVYRFFLYLSLSQLSIINCPHMNDVPLFFSEFMVFFLSEEWYEFSISMYIYVYEVNGSRFNRNVNSLIIFMCKWMLIWYTATPYFSLVTVECEQIGYFPCSGVVAPPCGKQKDCRLVSWLW